LFNVFTRHKKDVSSLDLAAFKLPMIIMRPLDSETIANHRLESDWNIGQALPEYVCDLLATALFQAAKLIREYHAATVGRKRHSVEAAPVLIGCPPRKSGRTQR
jgi:hypothetical protein